MSREEVIAKRIAEAPALYRSLLKEAFDGQCSPRRAIRAHCLECVGFDRGAITHCTGYSCPLWPLRPYQNEGGLQRLQTTSEKG